MMKKRLILAITGASGSLYAIEFLKLMKEHDVEVHAIISDAGRKVLGLEEGIDFVSAAQWNTSPINGKVGSAVGFKSLSVASPTKLSRCASPFLV